MYYTADIDITTFSATGSVRAINSDAVVVAGVEDCVDCHVIKDGVDCHVTKDGVDCHVTNSIRILEPE